MKTITGRVWKFGDHVDTDVIVSGQYLDAPMEEVTKHVFEAVSPNFAADVKKGDVIIAGKNFGCGSSREHAASALRQAGIGAIVAESFGRIFFRNAIAVGLPILRCEGVTSQFKQDDDVAVDIGEGLVENITRGLSLPACPLSVEMLHVIETGGILEVLRARSRSDQ
jgi:3-isopropylmalate dehydratase small subunit